MKPGEYRDRITIVEKIENDDGQGGAEVTPADLITVWASVKPLNANQALLYGQVTAAQGYNIECRRLKTFDITTKHGVIFKDKLLTIHACDTLTDEMRMKIIAFE